MWSEKLTEKNRWNFRKVFFGIRWSPQQPSYEIHFCPLHNTPLSGIIRRKLGEQIRRLCTNHIRSKSWKREGISRTDYGSTWTLEAMRSKKCLVCFSRGFTLNTAFFLPAQYYIFQLTIQIFENMYPASLRFIETKCIKRKKVALNFTYRMYSYHSRVFKEIDILSVDICFVNLLYLLNK